MKCCPNCKGTKFFYGLQDIEVDFINDKISTIQNEKSAEVLKCLSCGANFDLHDQNVINQFSKIQCTSCGNLVSPEEVDKDGLCIVCQCNKLHPGFSESFSSMSPYDQLKMISKLTLEAFSQKTEEKIEEANEVIEKPKRKGRPRKSESEKVEEVENVKSTNGQSINIPTPAEEDEIEFNTSSITMEDATLQRYQQDMAIPEVSDDLLKSSEDILGGDFIINPLS